MTVAEPETPAETRDRAAIIAMLLRLSALAHRCPYYVARYTSDPPTQWDRLHAEINAELDDLAGR